MGHTLCLLTLIAGQTAPAPTYAQPTYQNTNGNCDCQQGQASGRGRGWFRGSDRYAERPGLVNRIRDWFGSGDTRYAQNGYPQAPGAQAPPAYNAPTAPASVARQAATPAQTRTNVDTTREPELAGRPLPKAQTQTTNFRPQQTAAATATRAAKINPKFVNKIGHEDDYSWITGQLDQENGRWVIRYATPDTVDAYRGNIVLAPGANVSQLRVGDLVSATGQVAGQGSAVVYRVATINLIERD